MSERPEPVDANEVLRKAEELVEQASANMLGSPPLPDEALAGFIARATQFQLEQRGCPGRWKVDATLNSETGICDVHAVYIPDDLKVVVLPPVIG